MDEKSFIAAPNRTLLRLSFPVLLSLVAEPLTGLVDTAFVARLGTAPLAALGVGTTVLSGLFWIFNFLGIGSQTEVARAFGKGERTRLRQVTGLVLVLAVALGLLLSVGLIPMTGLLATLMGATHQTGTLATTYMQTRLLGAVAVLIMMGALGIMRGHQDMVTPFWVACGVNLLNVVLDPLLIFGWWIFPEMGVTGAALASILSQWCGAFVCLLYIVRRLGRPVKPEFPHVFPLFRVGRDLFLRTGALLLFLMVATRAATSLGAEYGAVHQVIRQGWIFSAFFLDAFAVSGQSLVAYFFGAQRIDLVKKVAQVVCSWSCISSLLLLLFFLVARHKIGAVFVPVSAHGLFSLPWSLMIFSQPINGLAFATDGLLMGAGDYGYMRNVVLTVSLTCSMILFALESIGHLNLVVIWGVMIFWLALRAFFGVVRVWPGVGDSPFRKKSEMEEI